MNTKSGLIKALKIQLSLKNCEEYENVKSGYLFKEIHYFNSGLILLLMPKMSDENINQYKYTASLGSRTPRMRNIDHYYHQSLPILTSLDINVTHQAELRLPPKYSKASLFEFESNSSNYLRSDNSFVSAPPPTADSAFEIPLVSPSKIAIPLTSCEFRRPLTSKSGEFKNKHEGKRIEISPIVLVGDSGCGKTSLIMTYLHKRFTLPCKSTLFETYDKVINFNNVDTSVKLQIWDFPGDEYFDRFRPLGYANAQGILICFAIDNVESFNNIKERWIPEITTHCPKAFKIMVGVGQEVRHDKTKRDIIPSYDQCYRFAKSYGYKYMESSFVDQRSCASAFEQIALWAIDDLTKNNKANKINSSFISSYHIKKTRPSTAYNSDFIHLSPLVLSEMPTQQNNGRMKSKAVDTNNDSDCASVNEELNSKEELPTDYALRRVTSFRKHRNPKCSIM